MGAVDDGMRMDRVRTLVVDDHEMVAKALASALAEEPGLHVVGTAGSVGEAVDVARRRRPDVILTDLALPEGEVTAHLGRLTSAAPGAQVVVMTGLPTERSFVAALRAGAVGYVAKAQPIEDLVRAVLRVADGELVVPPPFLGALLEHSGFGATRPRPATLTSREIDVVQLLAHGCSTAEVAEQLCVAVNTVRNHLAGAMAKLGASSRLGAVAEALRLGLISPPVPAAVGR
jgi:DNA-binding NarL/FixJ family response regulator